MLDENFNLLVKFTNHERSTVPEYSIHMLCSIVRVSFLICCEFEVCMIPPGKADNPRAFQLQAWDLIIDGTDGTVFFLIVVLS